MVYFSRMSICSGVRDLSVTVAGLRGFNGVILTGVLVNFSIFMILFRVLKGE